MIELPRNWIYGTLFEAAIVVRGITFPASDRQLNFTSGYICCLRTTNVQKKLDWNDVYYVPASYVKKEEQLVREGDILMSMANSYELVGKVARVVYPPQASAFGAFLAAIRPTSAIDGSYLYHYLRSQDVQRKLREGSSQTTNIANISAGKLSVLTVPLAPLKEQRRIAEKLDTVLARVDSVNARLARITPLLKRFRQSVLAAATSGRLTEDFLKGATDRFWKKTNIQSVALVGTGSTPSRSNPDFFANSGIPWVTSSATGDEIVMQASEFVTQSAIQAHRLKIYPKGTLLVAMYGEGKTRGQVSELGIAASINQACAAISVNEDMVLKDYLKIVLQSNYLEMRSLAEGGNQPNLNLSKIKEFEFLLPEFEEQREIVRRVDVIFAFATRLEARLQAAQTSAARLTPSLLAKAFRGELVPQDPDDEPAAELLKRLAETRPANKVAKKRQGETTTRVTAV